jgi:hypothetical protein
LFELQHQSHGDNGFFDIAAAGRVVQPIGNVLPCILLAEFGRQNDPTACERRQAWSGS